MGPAPMIRTVWMSVRFGIEARTERPALLKALWSGQDVG